MGNFNHGDRICITFKDGKIVEGRIIALGGVFYCLETPHDLRPLEILTDNGKRVVIRKGIKILKVD